MVQFVLPVKDALMEKMGVKSGNNIYGSKTRTSAGVKWRPGLALAISYSLFDQSAFSRSCSPVSFSQAAGRKKMRPLELMRISVMVDEFFLSRTSSCGLRVSCLLPVFCVIFPIASPVLSIAGLLLLAPFAWTFVGLLAGVCLWTFPSYQDPTDSGTGTGTSFRFSIAFISQGQTQGKPIERLLA